MAVDLPLAKKVGQGSLGFLGAAADVPRGLWLFLVTPSLWPLGVVPIAFSLVIAGGGALGLGVWIFHAADVHHLSLVLWILLMIAYLALVVVGFTSLVGIVGEPFYDSIAARIDPTPPAPEGPWWKRMPVATGEALVLLSGWGLAMAVLFLLGFVPVVGQTVVPAMQAVVSGFFLAMESMRIPLYRRGVRRLKDRLAFAWQHPLETIGFGLAFFLCVLVPPMVLLVVPGALVGATGLVRRLSSSTGDGAAG